LAPLSNRRDRIRQRADMNGPHPLDCCAIA
jgi:hypothetical protein